MTPPIIESRQETQTAAAEMVLVTEAGREVLTPDSLISRDIWIA